MNGWGALFLIAFALAALLIVLRVVRKGSASGLPRCSSCSCMGCACDRPKTHADVESKEGYLDA